MDVPLGWLAEWIELPDETELVERLTLVGLEVEEVRRIGPDLSDVIVGHVVEKGPHPNAERLWVCRVETGEGDPVEVVCGAPNVAQGQKIAFARTGGTLPDGTRLKKSKIRGVVSNGMICSERELGLSGEHEGILVLDPAAPLGATLDSLMGGESVLDVAITPNRGDCASMIGIAREVRAIFGGELRLPPTEPEEGSRPAADDVSIEIEDSEGCHRYVGRVVRGVSVGPSPPWLQAKLEAAGLRPINNVVDVSNLVLLEFGQPLHGFDLATIRGARVIVRAARPGEKIVTLDGAERTLVAEDLVIADAEGAIAVAGVMGGRETEVGEGTTDLLIESAHFQPSRVRRTARRLGLQTDASYRFERGVDRQGVQRAADRAARLLAEVAGGTVSAGIVEAVGSAPPLTEAVELDPSRVNQLLGTSLEESEVIENLARLGIQASATSDGRLSCAIPSHRNDLHRPEDMIEEVARIHGYDRIEPTLPEAPFAQVRVPASRVLEERARDALKSAGLTEFMTFVALPHAAFEALGLAEGDPRLDTTRVLNPILDGEDQLRTTLLPSLLRAAAWNLARQSDELRIFEVSRVFLPREEGNELPHERSTVAALLIDGETPHLWESGRPPLFYRAKGVVEALLLELGQPANFRSGSREPYLHPGASCDIDVHGQVVGSVGELHPEVVAGFELGVPCAVFEMELEALQDLPRREVRYHDVSRQPRAKRDLAVLLDEGAAAGEMLEAIRKAGGPHLIAADIFDCYAGTGVPDGKVSLAFRLVFQRPDRTLTDAEVAKVTDKVVRMLAHRFGAELR